MSRGRRRRLAAVAVFAAAAVACKLSISPLINKLDVGQEAYLVFQGRGEGDVGDLYAVAAAGGPVFPFTFSKVHETAPALSPDGVVVAFIRGRTPGDSASYRVWFMNLLNGAEREVPAFPPGVVPRRLGWSADGKVLYIATAAGPYQTAAPPGRGGLAPVPGPARASADSGLAVMLGSPAFARAATCPGGSGICTWRDSTLADTLSAAARDPARWGPDSVAYFVDGQLQIRPLGGGHNREPSWSNAPADPRFPSYFAGPR